MGRAIYRLQHEAHSASRLRLLLQLIHKRWRVAARDVRLWAGLGLTMAKLCPACPISVSPWHPTRTSRFLDLVLPHEQGLRWDLAQAQKSRSKNQAPPTRLLLHGMGVVTLRV